MMLFIIKIVIIKLIQKSKIKKYLLNMEVFLISNGCPSRIRTHGMSESESDALPLGYWAIT